MSAIKKWNIDRVRRATEEKGQRSYKRVISLKCILNLSVMMTVRMRTKIFLAAGTQKVFF